MAIHGFADLKTQDLVDPELENLEALVTQGATKSDIIKVFPNPTTREIFLNEVTDFAIYNSSGQRLGVYRNKRQANVSNLAPGTYFIQVANKGTVKFVVQ